MAPQALSHVRVIDLTHYVAGPYCTKLAAGFGAEVIKIERPGTGDPMRNVGPFYSGRQGLERSIPFLYLNTGKKSITLDLKTEAGVEILQSLIKNADVLVENFAPRVMPSLGLSYETLRAINPRLVMASISNFGQSGPYRDYLADEMQLYAMSGAMYVTGEPDKAPLGPGLALCQYSAGLRAYVAVLLALFERDRSDEGQYIDVSILEGTLDHIENRLCNYFERGQVSRRGSHVFSPWGLYSCRNGYVAVVGAPFRHWNRGAEMFQEPRLLDERYRHARDRVAHRQEIDKLIQPWLDRHDKEEICHQAFKGGLAFGYLASFDEVLSSPQFAARDFFEEIDHPVVGRHTCGGAPFKMGSTPWRSGPAPRLGEHSDGVYGERLGYSAEKIASLRRDGVV